MLMGVSLIFFSAVIFFPAASAQVNGVLNDYRAESFSASEIMNMLNEAEQMLAGKGVSALDEFKKRGSKWNDGLYDIFVIDPEKGSFIVYPDNGNTGDASLRMDSVNGKLLSHRALMKAKRENDGGIMDTIRAVLNPEYDKNLIKYARAVKTPEGKTYIILISKSNVEFRKSIVKGVVDEACKLIEEKGAEAFPEFRREHSLFRFDDTYIFVMDEKGILYVEPLIPEWEGKNIFELQKEKAPTLENRELIKLAMSKDGQGWLAGHFIKPGEKKYGSEREAPKLYFVKRAAHKGKTYIVGSGVYLEKQQKPNP